MSKEGENLRRLISENKIDQAIKILIDLTKNDRDLNNQVITQSAKSKDLRRKVNLGILDIRDSDRIHAEINNALLEIINEIEKLIRTVFISYHHDDSETANRLKEKLKADNISVTIDSEQMQAGEDIKEFIETSIRNTETTLSVVSKKSLLSSWVAMEAVNTFYHEKTNSTKKFIACYLDADFLEQNFTINALESIQNRIKEIQTLITRRMEENLGIEDLQNKLARMTALRNNMDKIVGRLHESLCIDIRGENFENGSNKIVQAIQS